MQNQVFTQPNESKTYTERADRVKQSLKRSGNRSSTRRPKPNPQPTKGYGQQEERGRQLPWPNLEVARDERAIPGGRLYPKPWRGCRGITLEEKRVGREGAATGEKERLAVDTKKSYRRGATCLFEHQFWAVLFSLIQTTWTWNDITIPNFTILLFICEIYSYTFYIALSDPLALSHTQIYIYLYF